MGIDADIEFGVEQEKIQMDKITSNIFLVIAELNNPEIDLQAGRRIQDTMVPSQAIQFTHHLETRLITVNLPSIKHC